ELSDRFQEDILTAVGRNDDVVGVLDRVLPEGPDWWLKAAAQLYPAKEAAAQRRPLLEKALTLLQVPPGPQTAVEWHTLASTHAALGQVEPALAAYRTALDREPEQVSWRLELASFLCEQRRFSEAERELMTIMRTQPGNGQAKALLDAVARGLASATDDSP